MEVRLKEKIPGVFWPMHQAIRRGEVTEVVAKGGRGSGKSSYLSMELVWQLLRHPDCHAVVLRKVGGTLRNSVYNQIVWAIGELGCAGYFRCTVSPMECTYLPTGQKILFFGTDDPGKLKSLKLPFGAVGICWFEELDQFDGIDAVRSILNSLRRGGDDFWIFYTYNPPRTLWSWVNREELERALDVAASYDRRILVEVGVVHPVEINCAAVGYGEDVRASVCEMPVPSSNDTFLDFWQKYLRNASTKGEDSRGMKSLSRVVPAPIGDELTGRIQTMTCDIFKLLDCCGTVRVDFILDQNDMLFVNEPNTIPGSLAFYLWKASGLDFPKLIEKMVEDALRAHADKNSSVFAYDSSILKKVAAGTKGSKR